MVAQAALGREIIGPGNGSHAIARNVVSVVVVVVVVVTRFSKY